MKKTRKYNNVTYKVLANYEYPLGTEHLPWNKRPRAIIWYYWEVYGTLDKQDILIRSKLQYASKPYCKQLVKAYLKRNGF